MTLQPVQMSGALLLSQERSLVWTSELRQKEKGRSSHRSNKRDQTSIDRPGPTSRWMRVLHLGATNIRGLNRRAERVGKKAA